jgi:hypothetical protein
MLEKCVAGITSDIKYRSRRQRTKGGDISTSSAEASHFSVYCDIFQDTTPEKLGKPSPS